MVHFFNFNRLGYEKRSFRNDQIFHRNPANNEKLGADGTALGVNVLTGEACQMLNPLRGNEITAFFVYLPDDAFQKRVVAFTVATKQPHFARMQDAGNIVAVLKKEPAAGVDEDSAGDLAMLRSVHNVTLSMVALSNLFGLKQESCPAQEASRNDRWLHLLFPWSASTGPSGDVNPQHRNMRSSRSLRQNPSLRRRFARTMPAIRPDWACSHRRSPVSASRRVGWRSCWWRRLSRDTCPARRKNCRRKRPPNRYSPPDQPLGSHPSGGHSRPMP